MWKLYLLVGICIVQTIPAHGALDHLPDSWVKRFSQLKDCIPTPVYATCTLMPDPTAPFNVSGTVEFDQLDYCGENLGALNVKARLKGFPKGRGIRKRGFHVHEFGDFSDGCTSTGGHFNPYNLIHGGPNDKLRHAGDFGNIRVRSDGTVIFKHRDLVADLRGPRAIVGRALVVHAGTDDEGRGGDAESKKTGNAGARLACCVIGRK